MFSRRGWIDVSTPARAEYDDKNTTEVISGQWAPTHCRCVDRSLVLRANCSLCRCCCCAALRHAGISCTASPCTRRQRIRAASCKHSSSSSITGRLQLLHCERQRLTATHCRRRSPTRRHLRRLDEAISSTSGLKRTLQNETTRHQVASDDGITSSDCLRTGKQPSAFYVNDSVNSDTGVAVAHMTKESIEKKVFRLADRTMLYVSGKSWFWV